MLIFSCNEKKVENTPEETPVQQEVKLTPELQNYENEIMKIHDEVMPKMSEVARLSAQLRDIKAKAGKPVDGLDAAIEALTQSEQMMSDWMKNYSTVKPKLTERQLLPFFQKEVEKVNMLSTKIHDSIEQAKDWLAANPAG